MEQLLASAPRPARLWRVRPEGEDPYRYLTRPWRGFAYLAKYLLKEYGVEPALIEYFAAQHRMLDAAVESGPGEPAGRIGLVGDLMWVRDDWDTFVSDRVRVHLASLGGTFGNLETPVLATAPLRSMWPDRVRFAAPPTYLDGFSLQGGRCPFAGLSLANNHILDAGADGARETASYLDALGVAHSGTRSDDSEPTWTEVQLGELCIGFFAATYGVNGWRESSGGVRVNTLPDLADARGRPDLALAFAALSDMAHLDLRLVSLHWGHEYEAYPTHRQMLAARALVQAGADILLGHHPHLVQPMEVLLVNDADADAPSAAHVRADGRRRRALVCYSLGNFATTMLTAPCRTGLLVEINLRRGSAGVEWSLGRPQAVCNRGPLVLPAAGRRRLDFADASSPAVTEMAERVWPAICGHPGPTK
jgi:poly-gamma-glutamate synthesis protein (capsule biosynthesis protein)